MPSLSLSFDVLDVWDVGCFVYECFWMLHLNLPRSHWEDLYRPFVTCHLSPVTCHLSQCRTQCRGHRSHSWRCGRVHWWAVMRWTSGFLPSNLRMCSWRRAWVEIKFKLCRCLSLSSNKNLMHLESCFRITPLSSDGCFRGTDAIGIGHRGFRRPGSGKADGDHPVVPRWVQVRSDHEGQPDNEVAGSYVWQLTFAFARALKTSLSQILWFKWLTCSCTGDLGW